VGRRGCASSSPRSRTWGACGTGTWSSCAGCASAGRSAGPAAGLRVHAQRQPRRAPVRPRRRSHASEAPAVMGAAREDPASRTGLVYLHEEFAGGGAPRRQGQQRARRRRHGPAAPGIGLKGATTLRKPSWCRGWVSCAASRGRRRGLA
jgi:hypothetical protein